MQKIEKKHIIIYIDLLGSTQKIINDTDEQAFVGIKHIYDNMIKGMLNNVSKTWNIKTKVFSDNVIIGYEVEGDERGIAYNLNKMIRVAALFQFFAMACHWPVRGGLTMGNLYIDDIFVWGKGLLRAYELENNIAVFPRIIIDKELLPMLEQYETEIQGWKMDLGLPIVDYLGLLGDDEIVGTQRKSICNLLKEADDNERVLGKIEWLKKYYNDWCRKSDKLHLII